jgi:MFS family permease
MHSYHSFQKYGRRFTIICNNVFFITGAIMCSVPDKWVLFFGRFLAGTFMTLMLSEVNAAPQYCTTHYADATNRLKLCGEQDVVWV